MNDDADIKVTISFRIKKNEIEKYTLGIWHNRGFLYRN